MSDNGSTVVSVIGENIHDIMDKLRARMATDLYFTLRHIFQIDANLPFSFDAEFHRNLCAFYWDTKTYPRKIVFAPRGGGKSTIRRACNAARFLLNPHMTQLISAYSLDNSIKDLLVIRDLITKPALVRQLFPEIVSVVQNAQLSSSDSSVTKREFRFRGRLFGDPPDPHFKAASVDSGVTGGHFDSHSTDDLIDFVNSKSPTECRNAYEWFRTSFNVLVHQTDAPWDITGTRYGKNDPYQRILENNPDFVPFIQRGLTTRYSPEGQQIMESYWPSRFSVANLLKMQQDSGPYWFAALIQQNPIQHEGAPFRVEWLRYITWDKYMHSFRRDDGVLVKLEDITIFQVLDPAQGRDSSRARSAIIITAMDASRNVYILDAWADNVPEDKVQGVYIQKLHEWQPDFAAMEEVLWQTAQHILDLPRTGLLGRYRVSPVSPHGRSKDLRIMLTQGLFSSGRVWIFPHLQDFIEEYSSYPTGTRDLLDAWAYGPDIWYPPTRTELGPTKRLEPGKRVLAGEPDPVTGY